jgi:hypothetical protein
MAEPSDTQRDGTPGVVIAQAAISDLLAQLEARRSGLLAEDWTTESIEFAQRALAAVAAVDDIKCTLDRKPPVDTRVRPEGPNDDLIRRCAHDPSHCWRLDGTRIGCP